MTLESAFLILVAVNIIGFWMLENSITKKLSSYHAEVERQLGYIQLKLGIDDDTKELMDRTEATKYEF